MCCDFCINSMHTRMSSPETLFHTRMFALVVRSPLLLQQFKLHFPPFSLSFSKGFYRHHLRINSNSSSSTCNEVESAMWQRYKCLVLLSLYSLFILPLSSRQTLSQKVEQFNHEKQGCQNSCWWWAHPSLIAIVLQHKRSPVMGFASAYNQRALLPHIAKTGCSNGRLFISTSSSSTWLSP